MTRFENGPAQGKVLMLRNAPLLLRVTCEYGEFDALDMPTDEPKPSEQIFIYVRSSFRGRAFVDGPKCRGSYALSNYRLYDGSIEPPDDAGLRNRATWEAWCKLHKEP